MNDDAVKAAAGRFVKNIGFTAQREIEKVLRNALATGQVKGGENLTTAVTLSSDTLGLNVTIFSRLKAREGSRLLWFRAGIASVLSQIVDTLIFITIAFYGVFPIAELLMGQMIAKVVLSALLVPPAVYLFVALGRKLDT